MYCTTFTWINLIKNIRRTSHHWQSIYSVLKSIILHTWILQQVSNHIVHLFCFGHAYKIKIIHTTKHCFCLFTIRRTKMKENIMIIISLVHFWLFFNSLYTSFYIHTAFLQNCTSLHVCNVLNHYVQNFYSFAFKTEKKINKKKLTL